MAQIHPSGWRELAVTGAAAREIETLALLEAALADAPYQIFHGVHWTNVEKGFSAYGEIDFIIVAPDGRVLLIEQKSGFLGETAEGLVKQLSEQGQERARPDPARHRRFENALRPAGRAAGDRLPAVLSRLPRQESAAGRDRAGAHHRRRQEGDAGRRHPRPVAAQRRNAATGARDALSGRGAGAGPGCRRHGRQCRHAGDAHLRRPGELGAPARIQPVPAAHRGHRRQRQDPAGADRIPRRAGGRAAPAVRLLQPPAGRSHPAPDAGRRPHRQFPHAVRRLPARAAAPRPTTVRRRSGPRWKARWRRRRCRMRGNTTC